jgi:hypothetical protein
MGVTSIRLLGVSHLPLRVSVSHHLPVRPASIAEEAIEYLSGDVRRRDYPDDVLSNLQYRSRRLKDIVSLAGLDRHVGEARKRGGVDRVEMHDRSDAGASLVAGPVERYLLGGPWSIHTVPGPIQL